jgi:hypothetical protein
MRFYLGSTYSDLGEHRDAAIAAMREFAKHGKESYVDYDFFDPNTLAQTGVSHLEACLPNVKESSYFVLILGWRYGYIPEGSEKSIVELEYEAAIENAVPRFCFLIDDKYPIPPKYIETGEGADKLKRLKARVQEEHLVSRFSTPTDLARELTLAISILNRPFTEATQALAEHSGLRREYRRYRDEAKLLRETADFYKEKLDRVVPADPIWRGRNFERDSTLCFVLMPFSDQFFLQYEEAIVPALTSSGLRGVHAGEIFGTREIMEDIWESICVSTLVIADVTGRNANVFYELGIAHTLGKTCVVLTQNAQDVPFDIRARRYLHYDPNKMVAFRTKLEKTIKNILL